MRKPFVVKIVGDYAWEQGTQRAGITVPLDVFARTRRVPFFVSILRSVQEYVAQHARTIIVPSIYLKSIVTAWGIDPTKIEVVYNALSIDEVIPEKILPPHTIVSVARLVPWKGMRELIDAVAQVRKEVPDATLIIIGDGPERAALEAHARDTAADSVQFLGALSHPETLANMRAASVFALNSTYEGLSHVLIEALLFGTPIVASDAGGNPELITNEQNGLLVPTGDTQALTQALVRALQGPKFSASPVVERFALPTMLKETSAILSRI
jgi:glycosyltransferase involved in cell wall biosynthesis